MTSAMCVASNTDRVICEQNMYVIEAKNVVFDDGFRHDLCSGDSLGVESSNGLVLEFCVIRIG